MPFWQRIIVTLIAMVAASSVAGALFQAVFNFALPSYLAGLVGGLAALPVWEFLKRVRPKK